MLLFFQMDPLLSPSFPPCYMSPFLSIVSSLHIHHTILLMLKLCRNKIHDVFRSPCTQHEVSTACPGPAVPFCIFVFAFHYAWLFLLGDFGYKIWMRHIPCLLTAQRGAGDGLVFSARTVLAAHWLSPQSCCWSGFLAAASPGTLGSFPCYFSSPTFRTVQLHL